MDREHGKQTLLLHRAFRRITSIINQQLHLYKFQIKTIKTLKITPTCFDLFQIIIRELCFSLLKLYCNIHNLIRFCKQGVVAACHVMQRCAVGSAAGQVCVVCYQHTTHTQPAARMLLAHDAQLASCSQTMLLAHDAHLASCSFATSTRRTPSQLLVCYQHTTHTQPAARMLLAYDAHLASCTPNNIFLHNMTCCHNTLFTKTN